MRKGGPVTKDVGVDCFSIHWQSRIRSNRVLQKKTKRGKMSGLHLELDRSGNHDAGGGSARSPKQDVASEVKQHQMRLRVAEFKNDPEKMHDVDDFINDMMEKARVEAERRSKTAIDQPQAPAQQKSQRLRPLTTKKSERSTTESSHTLKKDQRPSESRRIRPLTTKKSERSSTESSHTLTKDQRPSDGSKRLGVSISKARTSARTFASRVITAICNCTNTVKRLLCTC